MHGSDVHSSDSQSITNGTAGLVFSLTRWLVSVAVLYSGWVYYESTSPPTGSPSACVVVAGLAMALLLSTPYGSYGVPNNARVVASVIWYRNTATDGLPR